VAEIALDMGANFVNDVSGFSADTMMSQLVSERNVPIILMSSCNGPCLSLQASIESIKLSLERAKSNGIPDDHIIVDPGIGFGKPTNVDLELLKNLRKFTYFGFPVLVGVSRKAFIGELLGLSNPAERLTGTIAATSIAVANGANVIRAHDVKEAKMAARIGESLRTADTEFKEGVILFEAFDDRDAEIIIKSIGTSPGITKSLSKKSLILNVLVNDLKTAAALIIKQEMLALGGDAAYHRDVIDSKIDSTDVLIMGTPLHLQRLSDKLITMTYFGLNQLGEKITQLLAKREKHLG
jgi:dihydropteroate synthase